jgi:hypothetical protein
MIKPEVAARQAIDLIEQAERGKQFKPQGRAKDPEITRLLAHLRKIESSGSIIDGSRITAATRWNMLTKQPPKGWKFYGDAKLRPAACFAEFNKKQRFVFHSFKNILSRRNHRLSRL